MAWRRPNIPIDALPSSTKGRDGARSCAPVEGVDLLVMISSRLPTPCGWAESFLWPLLEEEIVPLPVFEAERRTSPAFSPVLPRVKVIGRTLTTSCSETGSTLAWRCIVVMFFIAIPLDKGGSTSSCSSLTFSGEALGVPPSACAAAFAIVEIPICKISGRMARISAIARHDRSDNSPMDGSIFTCWLPVSPPKSSFHAS